MCWTQNSVIFTIFSTHVVTSIVSLGTLWKTNQIQHLRASGPVRHGNRLSYFRMNCAAMGVNAKREGKGYPGRWNHTHKGQELEEHEDLVSLTCVGEGVENSHWRVEAETGRACWEGPGSKPARSVAQSIWGPVDCSPPGSSVQGIFQARVLEWVAMSSSTRSFWPRGQTHISYIGRQVLYHQASQESRQQT